MQDKLRQFEAIYCRLMYQKRLLVRQHIFALLNQIKDQISGKFYSSNEKIYVLYKELTDFLKQTHQLCLQLNICVYLANHLHIELDHYKVD